VPPRRAHRRPTFRRSPDPDGRAAARVAFERRTVPRPERPLTLRLLGPGGPGGPGERWELVCRDGWEWRAGGPGVVAVRVATLDATRAAVVGPWIERIKDPAVWWAVSRELQAPDSAPEVATALRGDAWLAGVLPLLLEASTEGTPPPPPPPGAR
jgi:hypothetical protein